MASKLMAALGPRGDMPSGDFQPDTDSDAPVSVDGGPDGKLEPKDNDGAAPEVHAFRLFSKAKDEAGKIAGLKAFISACSPGYGDSDDY